MAIKYIDSDYIKVFPAAFRSDDAEAKRTTEENLIKFNKLSSNINNLNQMFLDPDTPNTTAENTCVIFNIHGYWFRCLIDDIPEATPGEELYAYIKLEAVDNIGYKLSSTAPSDALDDAGNFTGLAFDSSIPTSANVLIQYYGMLIRDVSGNIVYQNLKLDANEIRNSNGDSTKAISEEFTTNTIYLGSFKLETRDDGFSIADSEDGSVSSLEIINGAKVSIKASLDVGTNTAGKVIIDSAGTSSTQIIGPDDETATLIAGTYGSAALLNNVEEGAQVNIIETFKHNNTEILPVNKEISITTGPNIYFGEDDPTDPSQASDIYVNVLDGKIYMVYESSWVRFPEVYVTIAKEKKTATLFDTYEKFNLLYFKSQRKVIVGENVLYIDARFRCIQSGGITYSTDTTAIALSDIDMEEGEFLNFECLAVSSTGEVKFLCGMSAHYVPDYGGLIIFELATPPGGSRTLAENDELVIKGEFSILT